MDKIVMRCTEGRLKGATSVVKRSTIKSGAIAVRKKVTIMVGEGKEGLQRGSGGRRQRYSPTASHF